MQEDRNVSPVEDLERALAEFRRVVGMSAAGKKRHGIG